MFYANSTKMMSFVEKNAVPGLRKTGFL